MDTRPLLAGIRHHPNAHDGGGDDDVGDGEEEEENCKRIDFLEIHKRS